MHVFKVKERSTVVCLFCLFRRSGRLRLARIHPRKSRRAPNGVRRSGDRRNAARGFVLFRTGPLGFPSQGNILSSADLAFSSQFS